MLVVAYVIKIAVAVDHERRAAVGNQRGSAGRVSMFEPVRPMLGLLKVHSREVPVGIHGQPVASFLHDDCDSPIRSEFQEPTVDVRHEDVALRIHDDA
jgi:hypothetical protein